MVGGESGAKARPCETWWIGSIVEQCKSAGVPVFVKQLGRYPVDGSCGCEEPPGSAYPEEARLNLKSHKGNDPTEWPEDLRVQEMPEVTDG